MRIIVKFAGTLLAGICSILAVSAVQAWNREVAFFESDMRLDHLVVGKAITTMVKRTWVEHGKQEALREPPSIDRQGRRQLVLRLLDPATDGQGEAMPAKARECLRTDEPTTSRDADFQGTYLPIAGPGDERLVLEIREPLAEEQEFARESQVRAVLVTMAVVALCTVLTLVLGFLWVGRPIQILSEGARRIGAGDLSGGLTIPGNSELSMLAEEMNAMCRDLSQARANLMRESERQLTTLEQLRHADRLATVGKLAAGVAHELGTPLNVVWAHANMVARGEVVEAEVMESARAIAAQSEHMTRIIRQLLDFARPRRAVKAPTNLAALVRQALEFLESIGHKRNVKLAFVGQVESLVAEVDPSQLQQVLTNLVVNAIQASAAGGTVTVDVSRQAAQPPADCDAAAGSWCRIDVRDTGTGISPENRRHLFEPFFTTKGVGEGTGLGLSVARGIVREHGGWIEVASEPGKGSCFSVFLTPGSGA